MNLYVKRLERGRFVWPQAQSGALTLSAAQLSMLLEGIDWVRRETDARQRVQVPHDEGVANHIDPESCGGVREGAAEALTGGARRPAIERRKTSPPERRCYPVGRRQYARRAIARDGQLRVVWRPWHACTSREREPRDLHATLARRVEGRGMEAVAP